MLYLYPIFQFGTVSLTHYNLWIEEMRKEGYDVPYQKSGMGFGFGMGVRVSYLEIGIEPAVFYTSSSSKAVDASSNATVTHFRRHTLTNLIFALPVGLSYPLTESFRLYAGGRVLMGFSNLSVYDSLHVVVLGIHRWSADDAAMSKSSMGMGMALGGNLKVSDRLSFTFRLGYDVLSFKGYEGSYESRASDGSTDSGVAYWVFNTKDNTIYVKDGTPDNDEIYAKEDLNGVRIALGLRFFLGR